MSNPTAAIVIIGDEILSGRTKDKNIGWLAEQLGAHLALLRHREAREAALVAEPVELGQRHGRRDADLQCPENPGI